MFWPDMQVKVIYFAVFSDLTGLREESRKFPEGVTVSQAFDLCFSQLPEARKLRPHTSFALNQEYVGDDSVLSDCDELVFIPPVSGG